MKWTQYQQMLTIFYQWTANKSENPNKSYSVLQYYNMFADIMTAIKKVSLMKLTSLTLIGEKSSSRAR